MDIDLCRQLSAWPKVDLHRHLEGSVRLETLSEVAKEYGIDLPGYEVEAIRPLVQVTDGPRTYRHFLAKFAVLRHFFRTRHVVERVAGEAVCDAAADNVRYLELRFTPTALASAGGFSLEDVTQWVIGSVRRAEAEYGIRVGVIMSMNRHESLHVGRQVAELAIQHKDQIAGLDLAGDEVSFSAAPFVPLFERARREGLGITVHAGEWYSSNNIVESIERLGAQRIGHGVRAIEDPRVVRFLKERRITLEICPTSNLQSGAVPSPNDHPLADLLEMGLDISINTDDPRISNITLTDEYALCVTQLGLSMPDLKKSIVTAARAAFLPDDERQAMVRSFESALHVQ